MQTILLYCYFYYINNQTTITISLLGINILYPTLTGDSSISIILYFLLPSFCGHRWKRGQFFLFISKASLFL